MLALLLGLATSAAAQVAVDPNLHPYYRTSEPLKGKITLLGSNTMASLAAVWADNFRKMYPDVEVVIEVNGAVSAVTNVIEGKATFGLLSRAINQEEAKAFHDHFGYPAHVLTPSLEAIGVYVHKDNPIKSLSLAQLDAIFSTSLKRGSTKAIRTWGELGVTGDLAKQPIVCQGRRPTTGSQVYFQAVVTMNGQLREDLLVNETNADLMKAIVADPRSIGFTGSIYELPETKSVAISYQDGGPALDLLTRGYPLVRPLQLVVNHKPGSQMPPEQREFLKYIFSRQGQEDVIIGGFQSIPAAPAQIAIESIGVPILN